MASFKTARIAEDMKRELSIMFRELKDPRIRGHMLSIVRVEVSGDLSLAKIYVSTVEGIETTKQVVEGLTSAMGYIKREISQHLQLRKCPELRFIPDDSIAYGDRLNQMMKDF